MYKEHPSFKSISDETKIWRFMDLAKFCDVLEKKSLFFIKPEKFPDPWEGYLPKKHFEETSYEGIPEQFRGTLIKLAKETTPELVRKQFAVNCWHISNSESEAFWRNYSERGIAIQTTFGRLKESLKNEVEYSVYIGKVEYKDHNIDIVDVGNLFNHILWKRKSFEYENELRAVVWEKENADGKGVRNFNESTGHYINTNLDTLIENIYTTPFERSDWFNKLVNSLIIRYGFNFPCIKSNLMDKPF